MVLYTTLSRAPTITDPESHLALRFLRERAGLTRRQVAELASLDGRPVSADFLAKCEADPERVAVRVARKPTPETLDALLGALGSSRAEWQRLLAERPWVVVGEGAEWEDDPAPDVAALHVRVSRALHLATPEEQARFAALADAVLDRRRDR